MGLPSLLCLCVVWVGCGQSASKDRTAAGSGLLKGANARSTWLSDRFAILRTPPERTPTGLAEALRLTGGGAALAQRLPLIIQAAWVIPSSRKLCLVLVQATGTSSVTCKKADGVIREGLFTASVPSSASSGMRLIMGVVPDGVSLVRVQAKGAPPQTVPVAENVFSLRDHRRAFPESIELVRGR